jgi:hypothetical protein
MYFFYTLTLPISAFYTSFVNIIVDKFVRESVHAL